MTTPDSVAVARPELVAQWDSANELSPTEITAGSKRRVWWRCPEGPDHRWQGEVRARVRDGSGCPFCAGRRASVTNSVAALHPELADQWDPANDLGPEAVPAGSHRRVWWRCRLGPDHRWQAQVVERTGRGRGCPYCAGRRASVTNSVAARYPELVAEWDPSNDLDPESVPAGSHRKARWRCEEGPDHRWQAAVASRTAGGKGCPFCSGTRASVTNSLASLNPEVARQWHPMRNGGLTPEDVTAHSSRRVWWTCPNGHEHQAKIAHRTAGHECRECYLESVNRQTARR